MSQSLPAEGWEVVPASLWSFSLSSSLFFVFRAELCQKYLAPLQQVWVVPGFPSLPLAGQSSEQMVELSSVGRRFESWTELDRTGKRSLVSFFL